MKVELLNWTPDPELLIAVAAKLCYSNSDINSLLGKQTKEGVDKFIKMLSDINHESPQEHVNFTFGIEGVSRVLTHQLVRHRIGMSYSQQSQRYVREVQFDYVVPKSIECVPHMKDRFVNEMERSQEAYDFFVEELMKEYLKTNSDISTAEKKAIEDARYVFPGAIETKIIVTGNARALKHFFSERCCARAQQEIRDLSMEMLKKCKEVAPTLFRNSGAKCFKYRICPEGHMGCGLFPTYEVVIDEYRKNNVNVVGEQQK